jgi:hypothetical protein
MSGAIRGFRHRRTRLTTGGEELVVSVAWERVPGSLLGDRAEKIG